VPGVRKVIYKRCVSGDRLKVLGVSNKDKSAGDGAKDLRFNPWPEFEPVVTEIFTDVSMAKTGRDVYSAPVYWFEDGERRGPDTIEFWSPNRSRPNDGRLARVGAVTPFGEPNLPAAALDPFFLIWQDTDNKVWGRYVTVPDLQQPGWHKRLTKRILDSVDLTPADTNIRGWVDLRTGHGPHFDGR
jgi:hypothetical protein